MLTHITVKDFIIVESLDLEFRSGLTVLTGETGAGKSLLLDALDFVLGGRADATLIRSGGERADVAVHFTTPDVPEAASWLREHELDAGDECLLRRTLSADGRSRAFINGQSVPVQSLRAVGEGLVDIHGQNVHQSLLKSAMQRRLLDEYADHAALLAHVSRDFATWQRANAEYEHLAALREERDAKLELLRYQAHEFTTLDLAENELETLNLDHGRLANVNQLQTACEQALYALSESEEYAALTLIDRAISELSALVSVDTRLGPVVDLANSASIQLQEAARALRGYRDDLDADPQRLQEVEDRLGAIHALARKHRVPAEELPALRARVEHELHDVENADGRLEQLKAEVERDTHAYRASAARLNASRVKAAKKLSGSVTQRMQELGMRGGVFAIEVVANDQAPFAEAGTDRVEFLVSANPGHEPRPLSKVASGGELSRISLALAVTTAQNQGIPTLIFDEVDAGVGGGVAEIVGRLLRTLAQRRQVFCVTHLPQVAAQGHHHFVVQKATRGAATRTRVDTLDADARVKEIGRMLGGVKITSQTLAHAQEMLEQAQTATSGGA